MNRHPTNKNSGTSAGASFVVRYAIRQRFQLSASVATSREGQRSRRSGREGQHRRWGRERPLRRE